MRLLTAFAIAVGLWHVAAVAVPQMQPVCPTHGTIRAIQILGR